MRHAKLFLIMLTTPLVTSHMLCMEMVASKFSSLSLKKNSKFHSKKFSSEWNHYKALPKKDKTLIYGLKQLQYTYKMPSDLIDIIAPHLILNIELSKSSRSALLYHLLFCFSQNQLDQVDAKIPPNISALIEAFKKSCLCPLINCNYIKKYQYKSIIPLLIRYDASFLDQLKRKVQQLQQKNCRTIIPLQKICNQSCIPSNGLWEEAFLYAVSGYCLHKKHIPFIQEILESNNLDINVQNYKGETALMLSALYKSPDSVEWLISKSANPKMCDYRNYTPLMYAILSLRNDAVIQLLCKHCDINHVADDQETALSLAVKKHNYEYVKLLLKHGAKPTDKALLNTLFNTNPIDLIKILIEQGANIQSKDENSTTFFMQIVKQCSDVDIIRNLLSTYVIDINSKNKNGETALMYAIYAGQFSIAQLLLEKNANPNAQDINGDTAFHQLIDYYGKTNEIPHNLLKSFFNSHFDFTLKNNNQKTVLNLALDKKMLPLSLMIEAYQIGYRNGEKKCRKFPYENY